jgi:hypothetical protein
LELVEHLYNELRFPFYDDHLIKFSNGDVETFFQGLELECIIYFNSNEVVKHTNDFSLVVLKNSSKTSSAWVTLGGR